MTLRIEQHLTQQAAPDLRGVSQYDLLTLGMKEDTFRHALSKTEGKERTRPLTAMRIPFRVCPNSC